MKKYNLKPLGKFEAIEFKRQNMKKMTKKEVENYLLAISTEPKSCFELVATI